MLEKLYDKLSRRSPRDRLHRHLKEAVAAEVVQVSPHRPDEHFVRMIENRDYKP